MDCAKEVISKKEGGFIGLRGCCIDLAANALAGQVGHLVDTLDVQPVQIKGPYSMKIFGSKDDQLIKLLLDIL